MFLYALSSWWKSMEWSALPHPPEFCIRRIKHTSYVVGFFITRTAEREEWGKMLKIYFRVITRCVVGLAGVNEGRKLSPWVEKALLRCRSEHNNSSSECDLPKLRFFYSEHTQAGSKARKITKTLSLKMLFLPALQIAFCRSEERRVENLELAILFHSARRKTMNSIMYAFAFKSPLEPLSGITQRILFFSFGGFGEKTYSRSFSESFHSILQLWWFGGFFFGILWIFVNRR